MVILGYRLDDNGCGDNSCWIKKPVGQGTNGGCRCFMNVKTCDIINVKRVLEYQKRQSLTDGEPNPNGHKK